MCVNHRSDTFTSVHWGIYVNHSLCDITNGEAYLKQADGAECWFKLLFLNYHCSQAHFKKKETWSGPDFWWEPRVLHSRSRSLQACWWSAEPTRWKGNDKRAKKLTHEVVCGFRVNGVEICFIPHVVGYLWGRGEALLRFSSASLHKNVK